jgi:transposase-like protein/IS1 family transposase
MNCPACQSVCKKFGKNRNGSQRLRCLACHKTFTDENTQPTDKRKLDRAKAVMALRLFLEGNSIRSSERLLSVHRDTIMALIVEAGVKCRKFLEETVVSVPVENVEADEIWGFVGCKEKTKRLKDYGDEKGDAYCFVGMERDTKLILAFHVDKRTPEATAAFTRKLRTATATRFQLSTDGYGPYPQAVWTAFSNKIDHGVIIKTYGPVPEAKTQSRYSPPQIVTVRKVVEMGQPDMDMVCTSHMERQNLNIRMAVRRMTRLTNAHSKKWENHEAALALYFAYYNFCRVHTTLRKTPAVESKLAESTWTVETLLEKIGL